MKLILISSVLTVSIYIINAVPTGHETSTEISCFCAVPLLSQCIALGYAIAGKHQRARESQEYFSQTCLYPLRGSYELITGDIDAFKKSSETFATCAGTISDHVPVVAHCKGLIHLVTGDFERAKHSWIAGSKPLYTIPAGVVAGLICGPAAGLAAGAGVAITYDELVSLADTAVSRKPKYHGAAKVRYLVKVARQAKKLEQELLNHGQPSDQVSHEVSEFLVHELAVVGMKTTITDVATILAEELAKGAVLAGIM